MPEKDKIQKKFLLTPAQAEFLHQRRKEIGNLSDYIRGLIAADMPDFPQDMPPHGDIERIPEDKLHRWEKE